MKKIWIGTLLTACLMAPAFAVHANDAETTSQDRKFVRTATRDSLTVERMSQIACRESQNPEVKQLADKLARHYANANQQLAAMAQTVNVTAPSQVDRRSAREINKLQSLSGAEFDQAALRDLVKAEQAYLLKIQNEAAKGRNPQLTRFASTTLPPLQDDIYEVVRLQSDLRVTASNSQP